MELKGEGKELVELIWDNVYDVSSDGSTVCRPGQPCSGAEALFRSPSTGSGAWTISDLTVYVTAYHNMIFYVNNRTVGFEMTRVRATANSFLGSNGPGKGRSTLENVTWGLQDPGPYELRLTRSHPRFIHSTRCTLLSCLYATVVYVDLTLLPINPLEQDASDHGL